MKVILKWVLQVRPIYDCFRSSAEDSKIITCQCSHPHPYPTVWNHRGGLSLEQEHLLRIVLKIWRAFLLVSGCWSATSWASHSQFKSCLLRPWHCLRSIMNRTVHSKPRLMCQANENYRIIESQNHLSWKIPGWSPSPSVHPALPTLPTDSLYQATKRKKDFSSIKIIFMHMLW